MALLKDSDVEEEGKQVPQRSLVAGLVAFGQLADFAEKGV